MGEVAAALARTLSWLAGDVAQRIERSHLGVAGHVMDTLGPLAAPVRPVHDGIARLSHRSVRAGLTGALRAAAAPALLWDPADAWLRTPRGAALVGAVLGLRGDVLAADEPALDLPSTLVDPAGVVLATARDGRVLPGVTAIDDRTVVVLLHGLCETEHAWDQLVPEGGTPLPAALAAGGTTVLRVRCNTGLRIGRLGRDVSALLAASLAPGTRIVLVGHSMGGLVARAALETMPQDLVAGVTDLVTLGTPHHGAPLEQTVDALVALAARVPEITALVHFLDLRSGGIRDLRHGIVGDEGPPGERVAPVPMPDHVRLHTVAGGLDGPAAVVGDGLVRRWSAHGEHRRGPLVARRGERLDLQATGHFSLIGDPQVVALVQRVVASG